MAALMLFVIRNSLAPAEHALIWSLALAVSMLRFALIAVDMQMQPAAYGRLPADFLGLAAAALYTEGFRQRGGRSRPSPIALVTAAAAALLVGVTVLAPTSPLRLGVVPVARAILLLMAVPMVLPRTRVASHSERAVATMLIVLALCDLALAGLAVGEALGQAASRTAFLTMQVLMIAPSAAAMGLFALLLIASDFSAQRWRLIRTDPLTGVLNRLGFEHALRTMRRTHPVSVAIADIDRFKAINDRWGHGAGDVALGRFARHLAAGLHGQEAIGRIGGEEFALLLVGPARAACERMERLRDALSEVRIDGYPALRLAASFGIAQRAPGEPTTSLIGRADAAMYRAKHDGRNRTLVADPPGEAP